MRQVVRSRFLDFTGPLEGAAVASLYNDVRGMTTIAYGNLVNSVGAVIGLPFVWPDGRRATTAEIASAWQAVHNDPQAAVRGWTYAARLTPLRLTPEGIATLVTGRLESNDRILLARLPEWESYGACLQMALHSLAWAAGANAHFPRLFQAVTDRDFAAAAVQIHMNEYTPEGIHNAGLVPRNRANKILLRNAARVDAYHLDPDLLEWERDLGAPASEEPRQATVHVLSYPLGDPDPEAA